MLPLSLLKVAAGSPLLVELKDGDTYNGRLVSIDAWMNMNLQQVICTSKDGDRFWKVPSCYIRGSAVKYLRLPPDLMEKAATKEQEEQSNGYGGRTFNSGGRGRGRGRSNSSGRTLYQDGGRGRGRGRGGREGRGRSGGRGRGRGGRHGGGRNNSGHESGAAGRG